MISRGNFKDELSKSYKKKVKKLSTKVRKMKPFKIRIQGSSTRR